MVVYILMNTRFLLLEDRINYSIVSPKITISKDFKSREEIFYDDAGRKELGTHTVDSLFHPYCKTWYN